MDEFKKFSNENSDEVYSEAVRAGKRTYFFDVKATKGNDYYITLTESRRKIENDGSFSYEKHKIFLYKEDFEKFENAFLKAIDFVKENKAEYFENTNEGVTAPKVQEQVQEQVQDSMSDIDKEFDAL